MIILNDGTPHEFRKSFVPDIEVIAHALSYINRFTGNVGQYSVAQHCVLVAMMLPKELKLSGLLHDATEAYLGDVSAPLKRLLPDYKNIEQYYHSVIDLHYGVETEHPTIKEYDLRMLIAEAKHFGLPLEHFPDVEPLYTTLEVWKPECAKEAFLAMYYNLTNEIKPGVVGVETPEEKECLDNIDRAQLQALGESIDDRYYCQCDNDQCGSWFQLGKEGEACKECESGKLHPQDVG